MASPSSSVDSVEIAWGGANTPLQSANFGNWDRTTQCHCRLQQGHIRRATSRLGGPSGALGGSMRRALLLTRLGFGASRE